MKIYAIGAKLIKEDNIALEVGRILKEKFNVDVELVESPDSIDFSSPMIIVDAVIDLDEVRVLEDMDRLVSCNTTTCHDMDLSFFLRLHKSLGEEMDVKIIGIPMKGYADRIAKDVKQKIDEIMK